MAPDTTFSNEYMLESDEGSPLPMIDFGNDTDTLAFLGTTKSPVGNISYPTPDFTPLATGSSFVSPQSLLESRDAFSASSSSSSKRTGSSFSAKSTFTAGDVTMSDGHEPKNEFKMSDFIEEFDEDYSAVEDGDGTINPSAIDNPFQFGAPISNQPRGSMSASNSPVSFHMVANRFTPEASLSPIGHSPKLSSPCAPNEARSHTKAHSVRIYKLKWIT